MRYRLSWMAALVAGLGVTAAAVIWFGTTRLPLQHALLMICPGLAFTGMLLLGSDRVLERARESVSKEPIRIAVVPAALWSLYLIYAAGMGIATAKGLAIMAVYLSVPFLVFALSSKSEPLVILWIWLPLELGIVRQILITHTPGSDLHYAFAQLLAIDAGIAAFIVWNRTPHVGYRFELDWPLVRAGLVNFFMFAVIAIPLGFAIHFINYSFTLAKLYSALPVFAGIFLFTAFPEEFLFRGLIQNWIERTTHGRVVSLLIASVIFGASHLNNGPPIPNYRYFLMAGIAGVFYGRAWTSSGSLTASALTHALVDTVWSVVFR
jgi:uncharacterized protein